MKENNVWLLPAGKVEDADDLKAQLDIENHWSTGLLAITAAGFVFMLTIVVIIGLTYPRWKHLFN